MSVFKLLTGLLITLLVVLATMALLGWPVDLWLTADQQGQNLMAAEKFAEAANRFEDPMRQGVAYFRDGQFEQASQAFSRVDNANSAFNRGNALVMLGEYDDAIKSYGRALQFNPDWKKAQENLALAQVRLDLLKPPEDDFGGTDGQLAADKIVFDDRAKNSSGEQEVEVGTGEAMSDLSLQELWLRRVQTQPADFLRIKFSYQLSKQDVEAGE